MGMRKTWGHSFYVRELRIQQDFVARLDYSHAIYGHQGGKYEIVARNCEG